MTEPRQFLADILAEAEDHGGWRAGMTNDDYLLQADAVIASGWVVHLPPDCQDNEGDEDAFHKSMARAWDEGYLASNCDDWLVALMENPYRADPVL